MPRSLWLCDFCSGQFPSEALASKHEKDCPAAARKIRAAAHPIRWIITPSPHDQMPKIIHRFAPFIQQVRREVLEAILARDIPSEIKQDLIAVVGLLECPVCGKKFRPATPDSAALTHCQASREAAA